MRGLLIKDFMLMKRQKLFFAAMGIVCVCFLFLAERENIMVELLSYGFMLFAICCKYSDH
ncbi:putative metal-binding protein [Catenibacillus scindens]|uniref:Putative metal-binding protein n=1 Tax=Catenibacillus scindens TaxID=673271 RepID=A0A7W8HC15_9FIRM|nr:putative metal-binding protein [Catenibacillus scindens]